MKRTGILNAELMRAITSLGHGDALMVVDAGFPVPSEAWRIDLALTCDMPDVRTVLRCIKEEMIVEGIVVADDLATHNAPLHDWLCSEWPAFRPTSIPHSEMLASGAARAKAVVRTGAFDPWGNILLTSGVDVPAFFEMPGVVVPDYYLDRIPGGNDG